MAAVRDSTCFGRHELSSAFIVRKAHASRSSSASIADSLLLSSLGFNIGQYAGAYIQDMPDLYLFIDEAGNFDFRPTGSKYFMLNVVATHDPCQGVAELLDLRHRVLKVDPGAVKVKKPRDCSYFHCADDSQPVRDSVFDVVRKLDIRCFSTMVQKNKTNPAIREPHILYERMFRSTVPYVISTLRPDASVLVFTSELQTKQKKNAFVAALKSSLASRVSSPYYIFHHPTESHHMLQVSDYCCWAIQRFHEKGDDRSRVLITHQIASEFDMFYRGTTVYY